MSDIILGYPGLTEQGRKYTRDPQRGLTVEILYEGPKGAILAAYATILPNVYVECDTLRAGPLGTLFLRSPDYGDGSQVEAQTSFDILPTSVQRSAYENARVASLGSVVLNLIRDIVSGKVTKDSRFSGDNAAILTAYSNVIFGRASATTQAHTDAKTLCDYMFAQSDSFFTSEIVFKVTDVIADGSEQARAYSNTARTYTSAQLIAETNPTAFYRQGIAAAESSFLADVYGGKVPAGTVLGWLKQMPSTINIPGNKRAVTVEYWLGAWPTLYYLAR
jgi:hypothetical protein